MKRILTSITIDLKFRVAQTPPRFSVQFTDQADDGAETHGQSTIVDEDAAALAALYLLPTEGVLGMLADVKAILERHAAAVAEPGAIAERLAAADRARTEMLGAQAGREAAEAAQKAAENAKAKADADRATAERLSADLDAQLAAKRAELMSLDRKLTSVDTDNPTT